MYMVYVMVMEGERVEASFVVRFARAETLEYEIWSHRKKLRVSHTRLAEENAHSITHQRASRLSLC